jgi:hypothetical protein
MALAWEGVGQRSENFIRVNPGESKQIKVDSWQKAGFGGLKLCLGQKVGENEIVALCPEDPFTPSRALEAPSR